MKIVHSQTVMATLTTFIRIPLSKSSYFLSLMVCVSRDGFMEGLNCPSEVISGLGSHFYPSGILTVQPSPSSQSSDRRISSLSFRTLRTAFWGFHYIFLFFKFLMSDEVLPSGHKQAEPDRILSVMAALTLDLVVNFSLLSKTTCDYCCNYLEKKINSDY